MLKYTEYIIESRVNTHQIIHDEDGTMTHRYEAQIGPHKLGIDFDNELKYPEGHYQPHFDVDGKDHGVDVSPAHQLPVMRHIQDTASQFIRDHKPKKLIMYDWPDTDGNKRQTTKNMTWKVGLKLMARKHGGIVQSTEHPVVKNKDGSPLTGHELYFPQNDVPKPPSKDPRDIAAKFKEYRQRKLENA